VSGFLRRGAAAWASDCTHPDLSDERYLMRLKLITPSLKTNDLRRTIEFYTATLGFTVQVLWPEDDPSLAILTRDDVRISFFMDAEDAEPVPRLTGQFWMDVEDVLALHAQLAGKVEVLWGPEVYHYKRREFAIRDPNGYTLTFSEPTDEPPTTLEDE
jgi:catechol 2,3-dioxygenase-like lactoylglutathione lyase family enzyme